LLRVSVGIEDGDDLCRDLAPGLERAQAAAATARSLPARTVPA
jgi:hypothetical protein